MFENTEGVRQKYRTPLYPCSKERIVPRLSDVGYSKFVGM